MNEEKKVKYGEIYFYDFGEHEGSIQNGLRPAVVIQDNKLNDHSPTTIIAAITSVTKKLYLPSHILIGEQFGLTKPSMILLEQVACVNQKDLGNFVGAINNEKIKRAIRCGLKKHLDCGIMHRAETQMLDVCAPNACRTIFTPTNIL